ncbi:hypothetical protein AOP6_2106 [Desulfuromonas sp. AOP6]|nr:hypothetical protein AOP6_2106 [Desulfuromonas sp. AOP6]
MEKEFSFLDLEDRFPPIIPRAQIQTYFPWLSQKRMANLDCQGEGPACVKNGRAILYPTRSLLLWLDQRNQPEGEEGGEAEGSPARKGKMGRKSKAQEVRERRG